MRAMRPYGRQMFQNFQNELSRMFGDHGWAMDDGEGEEGLGTQWTPAVDVQESGNRFVVRADLPGVEPDQVDITLENGLLTIRGERREEKREEGEGFHRMERFRGTFFRRFALPDVADSAAVEAHMDHGVLEIMIPKSEKAQARRIQISR